MAEESIIIILSKDEDPPTVEFKFGNDIIAYKYDLQLFPDTKEFREIASENSKDNPNNTHIVDEPILDLNNDTLIWSIHIAHGSTDDQYWIDVIISQNGKILKTIRHTGENNPDFIYGSVKFSVV